MTRDPHNPEALLSVSNEIEAAAIVTALAEYDIKALAVGGHISGFKAEAPGNVAVVVKLADFDRAKQALTEIRQQQASIDWSNVDVMETPETAALAGEPASDRPSWRVGPTHFWWTVELLGIAVCLIVWLFTRELTPALVYAAAALALFGIFLALSPFAADRRK